ncbi:hypothetical protein MKW92_036990 [Papaver armeniacum]|nr:hypothetical protein MKW92_036990 [Papaver armeniacum]
MNRDEEDVNEEEDGDDVFTLAYHGEMNPSDLIENDAFKVDELMGGMAMWKKTKELKRKGRKKDPETNMALKSLRNFGEANICLSTKDAAKSIGILEDYNKQRLSDPQWSMIDLLVTGTHGNDEHFKACQQIGHALLSFKAGICHVHLGTVEQAENLFRNLKHNGDNTGLITAVGNTLMKFWHYGFALRCFFMLEEIDQNGNGFLHMKILLTFFNKSLGRNAMEVDVDARLTFDEVIKFLSPSEDLASSIDTSSRPPTPWWNDAKNKKARSKKKLSRSILSERIKLLDNHHADDVFRGFRPLAVPSEVLKASRVKKSLQKKAAMKEERKAAAIAAGLDWHNDEHYKLILDLCKALESLRRYWEALEIINHSLRLADNILPLENREEHRSLGAQIAFATAGPISGYDYARFIVQQHPSRLENRLAKHVKFLHNMRCTHTLNLTNISQHQASAGEYLEAYKLMPDISLINLCHQYLAQGFTFLFSGLKLSESSQEALYDVSRACQHVGLVTLAVSYYERVLEMREKDFPNSVAS